MSPLFVVGSPGETARILFRMAAEAVAEQLLDGEVAVAVEAPGEYLIAADGASASIVTPPLATLKAERWRNAKAIRDDAMIAGCETPSGRVDTFDASVAKLASAAVAAGNALAAGKTFSVHWTMADNSEVDLDASAVIAAQSAVVAYQDAVQRAGMAIRRAIDAADDTGALYAIDITAGYPAA